VIELASNSDRLLVYIIFQSSVTETKISGRDRECEVGAVWAMKGQNLSPESPHY
jgi:hypothetical protein